MATVYLSKNTARRDLKELDALKKIKKVHGGAVSNSFNIYSDRSQEIYEHQNKTIIAQKGLSLINPGDIILISGGSTNIELAKLLPRGLNLTIFTPSLPMAIELLNDSSRDEEIIFIGGKLSRGSQMTTGSSPIDILSEIKADTCFLGTGYLDVDDGITTNNWDIAQTKKAMINASKKIVSLTIFEKLNTSNRYKICNLNCLDYLVTELDPSDQRLEMYAMQSLILL